MSSDSNFNPYNTKCIPVEPIEKFFVVIPVPHPVRDKFQPESSLFNSNLTPVPAPDLIRVRRGDRICELCKRLCSNNFCLPLPCNCGLTILFPADPQSPVGQRTGQTAHVGHAVAAVLDHADHDELVPGIDPQPGAGIVPPVIGAHAAIAPRGNRIFDDGEVKAESSAMVRADAGSMLARISLTS